MTDHIIYPLGENALTVSFGNRISTELNGLVIKLVSLIEKNPFPGFVECVPAYSTVTVFFDLGEVLKAPGEHQGAFEKVKEQLKKYFDDLSPETEKERVPIEIPVSFAPSDAPDLDFVSRFNNLAPEQVVDIFLTGTYRVFLLGFLPGFAYMGEVDERIAAPREKTPRTKIPKGSVGIAGRQTGIYPLESPGGWQIIGRTGVELFTPKADRPTLFAPGDLVKFRAVPEK